MPARAFIISCVCAAFLAGLAPLLSVFLPQPLKPRGLGVVTDLNQHMVEVSLGTDDGVAIGNELTVRRNGQAIAHIQVVSITTDRLVGMILRSQQLCEVRKGDQVAFWTIGMPATASSAAATSAEAQIRSAFEKASLGIPKRPLPGQAVIWGRVLQCNANQLIELSIGSDDSLRPGHIIHLYRENIFLGSAEVLSTSTDRSTAKRHSLSSYGDVVPGDMCILGKYGAIVEL